MYQSAIQAMESVTLFQVIKHSVFFFFQHHMSVCNFYFNSRIYKLTQLTFRTFNVYYVIGASQSA